ncbi:putative quinol monooxygenase [Gordonia insulae]|uniref:ABM domain-containing protein n=1 Tax=Gordonia insulae TaxID=2420509 RepID=A0A3G8JH78_9ACTN|nr:antibiotic biosynthesis monooxygenase [Gordonia insulae]AZG44426.1 hypothetical protein D7316_01012 [Gordonia insulae]
MTTPGRAQAIRLTGWIAIDSEELRRLAALLDEHRVRTLAESGCLEFSVRPSPTHPDRLLVDERFVDRAAFDDHQRRTADSAWGVATRHLRRNYTISDDTLGP